MSAETIADTLKHALFVPGLAGVQSADPNEGPAIAIMIEEQRDPAIASLFQRRASQQDQDFLADWKIATTTRARVLLAPDATDALVAYTIDITRPIALTRTYLILASKNERALEWLAKPGTSVWLIPHPVAIPEWAKEGAGTRRDMYDRMLPLGEVLEPASPSRPPSRDSATATATRVSLSRPIANPVIQPAWSYPRANTQLETAGEFGATPGSDRPAARLRLRVCKAPANRQGGLVLVRPAIRGRGRV
ncbi:MAG TPA: hypothetical protein VIH85_13975 [Solirubrobacteraceae bacterium]